MTKKEIFRLNEIIGSLMISQFKGKENQDEYRKVINEIFHHFFDLKKIDWEKYYQ
tara:strand:+ start:176 stop:340 length:165 start_codon:yes stop_codon:yes gene_type:complete